MVDPCGKKPATLPFGAKPAGWSRRCCERHQPWTRPARMLMELAMREPLSLHETPCPGPSVLMQVTPPTGEPDAGDPHVRFGGRGQRNQSALPTPISTPGRCLLDRPVKPGDDRDVCIDLNERPFSFQFRR